MACMSLTSQDLARFVRANTITAEIIHLPEETPTVATAAAALGVQPDQIVKSVLFLADSRPVLVVANGTARIHRKQLADTLAISRRRIKMAGPEQVLAVTGFPVGTVPPFGHLQPLATLVDAGVLRETAVYGGGGAINALMRLTPQELLRITNGRIVDVVEHDAPAR